MRTHSRRRYFSSLAAALLIAPTAASAAVIGFNQTTAGPFDYNTSANWVANTIDGIWDPTLTLAATQTVTFAADTPLGTGLNFGYTGNVDLILDSSSATPHTITLGGDILVSPVSNRTITIGNDTNVLNVDLGGVTRTFNVSTSKNLSFRNTISDGNINVTGGGTVKFGGANGAAASSTVTVQGATLNFDSSTSGVAGTTRAQAVTLLGGTLSVNGNSTAASADAVSGAITVDGASGAQGISAITVTANGSRNAQLTASSLVRLNNGVVILSGSNLGAAPAAGVANLKFLTTAPTLTGGSGLADTPTVSILPWAVGGTTPGSISSFVTYDTNGVRPLNTATEYFDASATSFDGFNNADNVRIFTSAASTPITSTVNSSTTINSLWLQTTSGTSPVTVSGTGTIHVTSGAVVLSSNATVAINTGLDFGNVQGVIGYTRGKVTQINGVISGSQGIVLYQLGTSAPIEGSGGTGVTLSTANNYTGDTYLFGRLDVGATGVLPSGSRIGDFYNNGLFNINNSNTSTTVTINGLYGNGIVTRSVGAVGLLVIGDNDANGNFAGTIDLTGSGSATLNVNKIGAGTQTFSGTNLYTGATTVSGGTLALSGSGSINGSSKLTVNGTGAVFKTNSSVPVTLPVTITKGTIGGTGPVSASGGVVIGTDAKVSPGNSPGSQAYTTGMTWAAGGTYVWEINKADGVAGTNYDQLLVSSGLSVTATAGSPFTISVQGLDAGNAPGAVPNFNNAINYAWLLASSDSLTGFSSNAFVVDSTAFEANNSLGGGSFSVHQGNESVAGVTLDGNANDVYLVFSATAVPEPASLGVLALGAAGLLLRRRRV